MKKIRTVCGDIAPEKLGYTLSHEHLIADLSKVLKYNVGAEGNPFPDDMLEYKMENLMALRDGRWMFAFGGMECDGDEYIDLIVKELEAYKALGGCSIIDGTYHGCEGRNWEDLKIISERSGVNVVCATGLSSTVSNQRPPEFQNKTEDELKELFEYDIKYGISGTGIMPGMLKVCMNTPDEIDVFRACARISAETGMAMQVHTQTPGITMDQVLSLTVFSGFL